jgi:hypothetical protein
MAAWEHNKIMKWIKMTISHKRQQCNNDLLLLVILMLNKAKLIDSAVSDGNKCGCLYQVIHEKLSEMFFFLLLFWRATLIITGSVELKVR